MVFWRGLMALAIIVVCCVLMFVILLQRGRGGGLAGAFGGAGGTSAFGAKTGDVFTWITVCLAAVFLLLAIVGNFVFDASAVPVVASPPPAVVPIEVPIGVDEEGAATTPGEPPRIDVKPVTSGGPGDENPAPATDAGAVPPAGDESTEGASDGSESAGEDPPSP